MRCHRGVPNHVRKEYGYTGILTGYRSFLVFKLNVVNKWMSHPICTSFAIADGRMFASRSASARSSELWRVTLPSDRLLGRTSDGVLSSVLGEADPSKDTDIPHIH